MLAVTAALAIKVPELFGLEWGAAKSKDFRFAVIDEAFGRGSEDSARDALDHHERFDSIGVESTEDSRRDYRERISDSAYGLGWRLFDYAGRRVVGHHGGVRGYRSLILFDPARRAGVVALWNASTGRPNAIEYEVMDMIYRLPLRDWLEIDERSLEAQPEEPRPENEGGSG
mgnify:CR=1 FL=1